MKDAKKIIGCKGAGNTKGLGIVTFGKFRPCKTKFVDVDITYDKKAEKELFECGMLALKKDPESVIEYVVKKALLEMAKCKK